MKLSRKMSGGELDDRYPPRRLCRPLRASRERPSCRRTPDKRYELAPPYAKHPASLSPWRRWSACHTLNLRQSDQEVLGIDLNCSESTEALLAHVLPVSKIAHATVAYETAQCRRWVKSGSVVPSG